MLGCGKKKWSLRTVEFRHGDETTSFTRSELAKAIAALLGRKPPTATKQAINGACSPQTDAALRERRNTVGMSPSEQLAKSSGTRRQSCHLVGALTMGGWQVRHILDQPVAASQTNAL